jgi:hypothetical protein
VEEQGEGQRGVGSGGRGRWMARSTEKSAAGQLGLGKSAGEGGRATGVGQSRGGGLEVEDRVLSAIL